MTVSRIYIDPNRATVSKPGVDAIAAAVNPSYRFLALDSRLNSELPLEVGFRTGVTLGSTISYAGYYGENVIADYAMYAIFSGDRVSVYKPTMQRDDNGTDVVFRSAYHSMFSGTGFTITDFVFYEHTQALPSSFNVCYMVWRL